MADLAGLVPVPRPGSRAHGAAAGGALVIFVLALLARPGVRAIALSGVLFLLAGLMQSVLAGLADNATFFGGLHALDGLLILGIAGFLYATARRRRAWIAAS
jgi:hypothetical protein